MPSIDFKDLHNDLKSMQHRLRSIKFVDGAVSKEMVNETGPTLLALAEHFDERLNEMAEVLQDVIDQSDSLVQPELAAELAATFSGARNLSGAVLALQAGQLSDMELKNLHNLAKGLLASVETSVAAVAEVTIQYEDDAVGDVREPDAKKGV